MSNYFPGTYIMLVLCLGQIIFLSLGILVLQYYQVIESITLVFAAFLIMLNYLVTILSCKRFFQAEHQTLLIQKQSSALSEMESTIGLIRAQRHDIGNHLHTIYALLQMGKEKQAKKYVNEVEVAATNAIQIVRLDIPEVAAFLQSKLGQAMARNISLNIEIRGELKNCLVKPYFLIIILGNLIENSFEAVEHLPEQGRHVELEILQKEEAYILTISNYGPPVENTLYNKIFEAGYSTKGSGRGYGLAIVQETVANHGGYIEMTNNPTTFTVVLPKKGGKCSAPQTGSKDS